MSQINVQEGEISLNERNSITGNSGLHNLTGTKARFQPVRIKALLSLFESEDDDTEPRDSDDNSDTESLQGLPDDDENYNNAQIPAKDEDPPPDKSTSKTYESDIGLSDVKNLSINGQIFDKFDTNKLDEIQQTNHQISNKSNSLDSKSSNPLSSLRKTTLTAPFKHVSNNVDNTDSNKVTIFTPRMPIDPFRRSVYSQSSRLSDVKFESRQENLIDFDSECKGKEPLCNSIVETPLKHETVAQINGNSCLRHKNTLETPQTKSNIEYSEDVVETPALIFSHWSRNNFFQTPTHNPISLLNKEVGQIDMKDLRLQPHRFCTNSGNRSARRPLSEAMHLNQGSSINESSASHNHVGEHQSTSKSSLLTKENCPMESSRSVKGNVANKLAQSLQHSNRQQDTNQQGLSAFLIPEQKPHCRVKLEMGKAMPLMSNESRDYEPVPSQASISDHKVARDGCDEKHKQHNFEGILNSENNNFGIESKEKKAGSILPCSNGQGINLPLPVNPGSNPGNVQFSIPAKIADNKYGKVINVKGSDYIVLGKLGQGMSGEVLRVQEAKTGELRAIKCVDLSCIEKETAQGCLEEVSMLDRLRAPCIINMFTFEIKSHLLYVVMEMGDTDLSKLLKSMSREKQLPLTMILYYWTEMLTAVKHIHDNGVIHSDLKPANFLLVRGRLKLIDFGIASTVNADMTSVVKSTSLGTLNYISPEAINDIGGSGDSPSENNQYKINFKSDVWSLGCILYSLVYGQTPFQHIRANWAKVNAITNPNQKIAFPPPESTTRRGYTSPPPFLVDVMRRCLQHDRKARPTVSQLLQIPYVGCNCPPVSSLPSIPPSILSKIKHSLEENEWRQLLEALERRKPLQ